MDANNNDQEKSLVYLLCHVTFFTHFSLIAIELVHCQLEVQKAFTAENLCKASRYLSVLREKESSNSCLR